MTAPNHNTHLADALGTHGISVVTAGHDHANEYCMLQDIKKHDMWMCFGGGAGFGGYGGYGGYQRRVRMFEIKPAARSITTWKRVEGNVDEIFEEQTLVMSGKAVGLD